MATFAVCIDITQILVEWTLDWILIGVAINWLIDIGMQFGYWMWFRSKGVNFKGTVALVFFGIGFLELFPIADEFPLWTIDVLVVVLMTAAEDKLGLTGKQIVENPRTRRLLKRGIMRAVNRNVGGNPLLRGKLATKSGGGANEASSTRIGGATSNPERDAKIAAQKQNKNEKTNQENLRS